MEAITRATSKSSARVRGLPPWESTQHMTTCTADPRSFAVCRYVVPRPLGTAPKHASLRRLQARIVEVLTGAQGGLVAADSCASPAPNLIAFRWCQADGKPGLTVVPGCTSTCCLMGHLVPIQGLEGASASAARPARETNNHTGAVFRSSAPALGAGDLPAPKSLQIHKDNVGPATASSRFQIIQQA